MHYYIITGISKGLGESIATGLLQDHNVLFGISRTKNKLLLKKAYEKDVPLHQFSFDLGDLHVLESLMNEMMTRIDTKEVESITLINNAALIGPIQPAKKNTPDEITRHMNVNLIAPMILSSLLMDRKELAGVKKTIVNISSGAAKSPYYGWNCYCASKAGLTMYTDVAALEADQNNTKFLSFSPGIMDTNMQQEIRETPEDDFVTVKKFQQFKEGGHLQETAIVAKKLIKLLEDDQYTNGDFISVYDL